MEASWYFNLDPSAFSRDGTDGRRRVDAASVIAAIYRVNGSENPQQAAVNFFSRSMHGETKTRILGADSLQDETETGRRRYWLTNRGVAALVTMLPSSRFTTEFKDNLITCFSRLLEGDDSVGAEVRAQIDQNQYLHGMGSAYAVTHTKTCY